MKRKVRNCLTILWCTFSCEIEVNSSFQVTENQVHSKSVVMYITCSYLTCIANHSLGNTNGYFRSSVELIKKRLLSFTSLVCAHWLSMLEIV